MPHFLERQDTLEHCPTCRSPLNLVEALARLTAVVLELHDHVAELLELDELDVVDENQ
jgi:hypothetical protein